MIHPETVQMRLPRSAFCALAPPVALSESFSSTDGTGQTRFEIPFIQGSSLSFAFLLPWTCKGESECSRSRWVRTCSPGQASKYLATVGDKVSQAAKQGWVDRNSPFPQMHTQRTQDEVLSASDGRSVSLPVLLKRCKPLEVETEPGTLHGQPQPRSWK